LAPGRQCGWFTDFRNLIPDKIITEDQLKKTESSLRKMNSPKQPEHGIEDENYIQVAPTGETTQMT